VAYGVTRGGSDWTVVRVRDAATGRDLPDEIHWVKFSEVRWARDGEGFFYSRFPEPPAGAEKSAQNFFQRLMFHRLGTPQAEDLLVYERADEKTWTFQPAVTEDGRYLVVTIAKSTDDRRRVLVAELVRFGRSPLRFRELVKDFEAGYSFIGSRGPALWFRTNLGAPNGRVVTLSAAGEGLPKEIVPESKDALGAVRWVDDRLVAAYLVDARSDVRVFDTAGKPLYTLALPGVGTVRSLSGKQSDRKLYFSFTSFVTPHSIYELSPKENRLRVFRAPQLPFDPGGYETRQVFVTSKDGTRVPMFVSHRKGLVPNEMTPAYLHGYGGFNVPVTPGFDVGALVWMERGGLFAVASLRGGGEYGKAWHEAGMKHGKQKVFDDFIAAAEWLVGSRYTSPARLAIGGRSNGGLLVGACMTQRPELFGVALPAVGVMDMLRFHRFTIGWAWADEYGTSDDPAELETLLAYSPLHNIKPGTRYPATLVTAADHDDRVVPAHSLKFAAALQAAQGGDAPVLLRLETVAGHGAGTPTRKKIEEEADRWAFVTKVMGL
jgi:prolyl oligopeptidase